MNWFNIRRFGVVAGLILAAFLPAEAAISFPNINIGMQNANTPQDFTNGLQILIWLTILTGAWCRQSASKPGYYKFGFDFNFLYYGAYV